MVDVQVAGSDAPARSPEAGARRDDIQGLRALAVVLVVLFHSDVLLGGGFLGVDVFFVISGFVITAMLLRELERTDTVSLRTFYTRRARRLLPALAVTLVAVVVLSAILLSPLGPQQRVARTGAATSLFSSNLDLYRNPDGYFDAGANANPLLHTWSLAVEEQFYLLFPAFVLIGWRLGRRRRWSPRVTVGAALAGACVLSFVAAAVLVAHSRRGAQLAFYASPTRAWEFGVGALLAVGVPVVLRLHRRFAGVAAAVGLVVVLASSVLVDGTRRFPPTAAAIPVVGTALLILAGTLAENPISRALSWRPLVWLGDVSYGWYLWHWPFIVFARELLPGVEWAGIVAALASLLPTWLSVRYVENPLRFDPTLTGRRVVRLAVLCVIGPLVLSGALYALAKVVVRSSDDLRARSEQAALHADVSNGCASKRPLQAPPTPTCVWEADGPSQGLVVLVGDSNAGHFTEPLADAANERGYDFTVATAPGCPFVALDLDLTTEDGPLCERFVAKTVERLQQLKPSLVVIGSSASGYISTEGDGLRPFSGGDWQRTPQAKAQLWDVGLRAVLDDLREADIPTVVMHTVPHFETYDLRRCPMISLLRDAYACGASQSRADAEEERRLGRAAIEAAAAKVDGVRTFDLFDDVCPGDTCVTTRDRLWLYRDRTHLSIDGARTLTDRFISLLDSAG